MVGQTVLRTRARGVPFARPPGEELASPHTVGAAIGEIAAVARQLELVIGSGPDALRVDVTLPEPIVRAGQKAWERFVLFFLARLENPLTAKNYARDSARFFAWRHDRGIRELSAVTPMVVSTYRSALWTYDRPEHMRKKDRPERNEYRTRHPVTVQRNLSAISALFRWLSEKDIVELNPVAVVKRPKFKRETGATPVLDAAQAVQLFASIDTSTVIGLRDRALISVMAYSFARVEATVGMNLEDYFPQGKKWHFRLREKNAKEIVRPAHHLAEEYLDAYIKAAGLVDCEPSTPLFRTWDRKYRRLSDRRLEANDTLKMIKRRARAAGIPEWRSLCNHTFRASGITDYLRRGGSIEYAQFLAGHSDVRSTRLYDRRKKDESLDEIERIQLFTPPPGEVEG
ncbi:MAG: tyrosine-type recombinase/integrase [Planctomycetota bacterium]